MRILFVGVFDPPESSHHPMVRALTALGHQVEEFDYRRYGTNQKPIHVWRSKMRMLLSPLRASWTPGLTAQVRFSLHNARRRMNVQLLEKVRRNRYDLVFLAKAELVDYRLVEEFNRYARTWYYFMDPLSLARRIRADEYARRATFSSASRRNVTELFQRAGGRSLFITQGAETELFNPAPSPSKTADVVFAGRLKRHRKSVLEYLASHGISVTTYGQGCDNPAVYREDLRDVYRTAKIALNLNSETGSTGFSLRVFEVLATGTMLVSEHCRDLELLFAKGQDMEWFHTPDKCLEIIKRYLADNEARERVAQGGWQTVNERFTWRKIMGTICDTAGATRP